MKRPLPAWVPDTILLLIGLALFGLGLVGAVLWADGGCP